MTSAAAWFDAGADAFCRASAAVWEPIGRAAAAVADPAPGTRVLDACCGSGASAIPLAQAVGTDGRVDAVDLAAALVASGRAVAGELPQLAFHAADATTWSEHHEPYDHVVCVLGVYFLPDLDDGTRQVLTNLADHGAATITVWGERALHPLAPALYAAAVGEAPDRFPAEREPTPGERLADPGHLRHWGERLGLRDVGVVESPHVAHVDADTAWALVEGTAFAALLAGFDTAARARIRTAVLDAMATADWRLELPTLHLTGRRRRS